MHDLQSLLEKINRDGVEKAEEEAAKIIAAAKAKAEGIIKDARDEAEKERIEAEKSSQQYAEHAAETVRQAARDTILKVESSVKNLLEKLLLGAVEKALADEETAVGLAADAIKAIVGEGEIVCGEKLATALAAKLAGSPFTVSMDNTFGTGFSVRVDNGRVESAFTAEVIAAELAKRLRPDLAKLVETAK